MTKRQLIIRLKNIETLIVEERPWGAETLLEELIADIQLERELGDEDEERGETD